MLRSSCGIARPDLDLLVGVVGPVFAHLDAVGHELDRGADLGKIGAENRRLRPVDGDLPLDARHGPAVLDIDEAIDLAHCLEDQHQRRLEPRRIVRTEYDLHRLADRRTGVGRAGLDQDAGELGGPLADFREDFRRRGARLPVGELELVDADNVLCQLLAQPFAACPGNKPIRFPRCPGSAARPGDQRVFFPDRQVASGVHLHLRFFGLHIRGRIRRRCRGSRSRHRPRPVSPAPRSAPCRDDAARRREGAHSRRSDRASPRHRCLRLALRPGRLPRRPNPPCR